MKLPAGGDDVGSRLEERTDHVDIAPLLHEEDAVGLQRKNRLDVPGGDNAGQTEPAQITGVTPGLALAAHPHAGQLELGMLDHGPQ